MEDHTMEYMVENPDTMHLKELWKTLVRDKYMHTKESNNYLIQTGIEENPEPHPINLMEDHTMEFIG